MKKKKRIILIVSAVFGVAILTVGIYAAVMLVKPYYIADSLTEETNILLPKSETAKVTSTAKGDNQSKVARLHDDVFTYYLDNTGCTDASIVDQNDKTMRLIKIDSAGAYVIFDSIPVWMHGNVLVNEAEELIYYTTYEATSLNNRALGFVKIYTYDYNEGNPLRIDETTLAADDEDSLNYLRMAEANPRVGADIDPDGNIAVAFDNYPGIMYVHVYDHDSDTWIKHVVPQYQDTYFGDCTYYPYVRIHGINTIKIIAGQDTAFTSTGEPIMTAGRAYTRYFSYDGTEWSHWIIADVREPGVEDKSIQEALPCDLYLDEDLNTHAIVQEGLRYHHFVIDPLGNTTEIDLFHLENNITVNFIRIVIVNDIKMYLVSGSTYKNFKQTGFIELYDYESHQLLYRNNALCNVPYPYVAGENGSAYLDIMIISRDGKYVENCDTFFIQLVLLTE